MSIQRIRYDDLDDGSVIAVAFPASAHGVQTVMNASIGTEDGRSEWHWLRLANGDLMLGVWPQGETYFEVEGVVESDYKRQNTNNVKGVR